MCACMGGGLGGGSAAPNEGHAGWPLLARPLMHPRPPGLPGSLTEGGGGGGCALRVQRPGMQHRAPQCQGAPPGGP